jgi:hypothetical protein
MHTSCEKHWLALYVFSSNASWAWEAAFAEGLELSVYEIGTSTVC